MLSSIEEILENLTVWDEESIDLALKNFQSSSDLPTPKVNQPIRIAVTGGTKSPSLGLTLEIIGKEDSLMRVKKALDFIG